MSAWLKNRVGVSVLVCPAQLLPAPPTKTLGFFAAACSHRNNTIRALIRVSIVETNIIAKKKECSFVLNHTQCVMLFDAKCAYNEAPLDDEHILFSVETLYRVGVYVEAWK